ncbi:hypothetical protein [Streptomyces brasiliensis]|uniref:hypothetical protein n=1 Tax=Streptomyces brasiliensis TaxID=1954 RepID=UPI001670164D|nr:hypothetical protein [Streptomyces brasiliensis]
MTTTDQHPYPPPEPPRRRGPGQGVGPGYESRDYDGQETAPAGTQPVAARGGRGRRRKR